MRWISEVTIIVFPFALGFSLLWFISGIVEEREAWIQPMKLVESSNDLPDSLDELSYDQFSEALWEVETGKREGSVVGDNGKSFGPLQISRSYWLDAVAFHPELKQAGYGACSRFRYSKTIVRAYMLRWARKAWVMKDFEVLARIHNGGPMGNQKDSTISYWRKVKVILGRTTNQQQDSDKAIKS